jgi:hypothetical protein
MIDAASRLKGVEQLIDMGQNFIIHAAWQSGKTTYLQNLANRLNADGEYYALYCSLESVLNLTNPKEGIPAVIRCLKDAFLFFPQGDKFAQTFDRFGYMSVLQTELTHFCMQLNKPLVILFDDMDCLSGRTLVSFLRQLRSGYNGRFDPTIRFMQR